jgi:hypothetical protein
MELIVVLLVFFLWFCACLFVAGLASGRGRSAILFFLIAVVATPVWAVVILLLTRNLYEESVLAEGARRRRTVVMNAQRNPV